MRAWLLAVVSSEGQAETLAYQRAWAAEVAAERGWTLERTFSGVSSGKDGPRALVREMLAALREPAGRPDWLLMIRLDRLGRESLECQFVLRDIRELGVKVWTRDGGEERGDSAMERFISAAKLHVAEHENEVKRDKLLAVYKRKRAAGLAVGNKRPYGLKIGPDGKDVAVEDQADAVRVMFRMRGEAVGLRTIAKHLVTIAPPQHYKRTGPHPMRWNPTLLRGLLANTAYIGTVIDEVTFRRVQQVNAELATFSERTRKHPWPLSGSIRCYCGWAMIGHASGSRKLTRYYSCRSLWNHDDRPRHLNADKLEAAFLVLLAGLSSDPELVAETRQSNLTPTSPALMQRALKTVRAELVACDRRRDRVWEIAEAGSVSPAEVQPRLDQIADERAQLVFRIDELEAQLALAAAAIRETADVVQTLALGLAAYGEASWDDQQRIVRAFSAAMGGLCAERDGTLSVRRPVDATSRVRQRRAKGL